MLTRAKFIKLGGKIDCEVRENSYVIKVRYLNESMWRTYNGSAEASTIGKAIRLALSEMLKSRKEHIRAHNRNLIGAGAFLSRDVFGPADY